jgi:PHS family inorganic phosphate transporter-like MFS transporter
MENKIDSIMDEVPQRNSHSALTRRQQALAEIDNAKFGWFHIKACIVSGVGFLTDAYDIFVISLAVSMISIIYFDGKIPANLDMGLKVATPVGTFIGQLLFGYLADRVGRKKMYGVELMIIIVCTIGQCLVGFGSKGLNGVGAIIALRVIMGIGIGGDYPLSAVITSEFATTKNRGAMMAAVFAMQGVGILGGSIVSIIVLAALKNSINADVQYLDYAWRIIIGLGTVPGMIAVYFRLTIPETPRYTMDIENDVNKATKDINKVLNNSNDKDNQASEKDAAPKASWSDFCQHFGKWENFKVLLGTSVTWFALDVAFYGLNLNNPVILKNIGYVDKSTPFQNVWTAACGAAIIALLGTVPGYWVTVFTIDRLGRKTIQYIGFVALTIAFAVLGFAFHQILNASLVLFIIIFTIANFFTNFGPNTTTFIVPGEVFPTRYRSTAHGISAASGKLGAIVSQVGFSAMKDIGGPDAFVPQLIQIFALFMLIGTGFTYFIPETKGKSLEELANEEF